MSCNSIKRCSRQYNLFLYFNSDVKFVSMGLNKTIKIAFAVLLVIASPAFSAELNLTRAIVYGDISDVIKVNGSLIQAWFRLTDWQGEFNVTATIPRGIRLRNSLGNDTNLVLNEDLVFNLRTPGRRAIDRRGDGSMCFAQPFIPTTPVPEINPVHGRCGMVMGAHTVCVP